MVCALPHNIRICVRTQARVLSGSLAIGLAVLWVYLWVLVQTCDCVLSVGTTGGASV